MLSHAIITLDVSSLKWLCTSVIMSALLQQRSLEPDRLQARLPDYLPPRTKQYITRHFKTQEHHLQREVHIPQPPPLPPLSTYVASVN